MTYRLLHVEDSPDDAELLVHALQGAPFAYTLTRVETEARYVAELDRAPPDAIICDYNLPQFSAERALEIIRARSLDLPFIIVSHHLGESEAVLAMQQGASDYLPKRNLQRLAKAIDSAIDRSKGRLEKARAQEQLRESEAIRRGILNSLLSRIALVDGDGVIMAVNRKWEEFEDARPGVTVESTLPGCDYLAVLKAQEARGSAFAGGLAEGLRAVMDREKKSFSIEFQAPGSSGMHWYVARALPLEESERATVVSFRDVTDRMLVQVALQDANKRLRTLSKRMLAIQEDERRAISRELHDDIGQTLGALKIGLHRLESAAQAPQKELVAECLGAAGEAIDKLRSLAMDLRPPQLDQLGLEEALLWLAERQSAACGLAVTCKFSGLEKRPPASLESVCYRIAQEALNNAARHASAKEIRISVQSDGSLLKLAIHDDGIGFDADAARLRAARAGSMGLIGMEERAQLAGGRLKLRSVPGAGTTVSAIFPLAESQRSNIVPAVEGIAS